MGSSGGSSSGKVSYPAYMENRHEIWLGTISSFMDAATNLNPYLTAVTYDPDSDLANNAAVLALYNSIVTGLNPSTDWQTFLGVVKNNLDATVYSSSEIADKVNAYKNVILARLQQDILPNYQRGMQNVRAVITSSFTIGEALLTADAQRDVDKYEADLRRDFEKQKNQNIVQITDSLMVALLQKVKSYNALAAMTIESNRIRIVAKKEEANENYKYEEKAGLWNLELYQYGGNVMASIGGAASVTTGPTASTGQSVIGGALSGASLGTQAGGGESGWGTGIGAVLGGISGLL